jgi:L-erythro-3,5-diaminohexanoate dehydrogenase
MNTSPLGLHRVLDPPGVLPQAAWRLDASPAIAPDEVRIRVDRLNLDAASYRQLRETYSGDPDKIRRAVLDIITTRGKMQNPVTGSGGMLTGTVDEAGPESPLGLKPGQRIATLVSLTLTPLQITDGLSQWDGQSEQVPCDGHAILFARSIAAVLPEDLSVALSLAVLDVCGAPALTRRVVTEEAVVLVVGAAGKSGSLSAAAARQAGAAKVIGVVPTEKEAALLRDSTAIAEDEGAGGVPRGVRPRRAGPSPAPQSPLMDEIVVADARDPVGLAEKVEAAGGPADVAVVCVDVAGCEGGAILSTRQGGST